MDQVDTKVTARKEQKQNTAIYQNVWRWHFYAGLFVIPFLLVLSVTGMIMLYDQQIQDVRYNGVLQIQAQKSILSITKQLQYLDQVYPQAKVRKYIPAHTKDRVNFFVIRHKGKVIHVALNPYTGQVVQEIDRNDSWYAFANDVHGSLLLGEWGDMLIETATGFIVLLLLTGVYLWVNPKLINNLVFWPRLNKGKKVFYRQLHSSLGLYSVIFLIFFTLSGLSWSGVWGAKFVQAWNSFPAQKWADVPLSIETHASLNQGVMEEMPWNLEQTQLPLSKPLHKDKAAKSVGLPDIEKIASALGMKQFQVNLPLSKQAVFTLSADTMSGDVSDPRLDRTVHIDQYSGEILADTGWSDYSLMAKFMAAGVGLHQGGLGWLNLLINTLLCLIFIVISLTGIYMWWLRRPLQKITLNAPKKASLKQRWYTGIVAVLLVVVLFPLTGAAIVVVLLLDVGVLVTKNIYIKWQAQRA